MRIEVTLRERQKIQHVEISQYLRHAPRIRNTQAALGEFLYAHAIAEDEIASHDFAHARDDFQRKTQTLF